MKILDFIWDFLNFFFKMSECVHRDAFLDVQTTFLEHRERETLFVSFRWNLADWF